MNIVSEKRIRQCVGLCLLLAGGIGLRAQAPSVPNDGAAIRQRWLSAYSDATAPAALESLTAAGWSEENGKRTAFELCVKRSGEAAMVARSEGGVEIMMVREAGGKSWAAKRGRLMDIPTDANTLLSAMILGYFPVAEIPLCSDWDAAGAVERREGERTVIEIKRANQMKLQFDVTSGRLVRAGMLSFSDFKRVQGVELPFEARAGQSLRFVVETVEVNKPVAPETFAVPPGAVRGSEGDARGPGSQLRPHDALSAAGRLEIANRPKPARFNRPPVRELASWTPKTTNPFLIDLRSMDASALDLTGREADLAHASFDQRTRWPATMPAGFSPEEMIRVGKNPGLGIRAVHAMGVTGHRVGIAIIDQELLTEHVEYRDQIRSYEEIHVYGDSAQMHGPAVASIAVGKSVGVAPGADLYYIAETHADFENGKREMNFNWVAKAIDRVIEINASLPQGRRIRVISLSVGWRKESKGGAEAFAAVERASKANIFVISTAIEQTHQLAFHGLGRLPMSDPDKAQSYTTGSWWSEAFWSGKESFDASRRLLVPMDCRAVASPTGSQEYVFYADGGWSWSVPWIAGLYALACEVRPEITPEQFWAAALKTGRTIKITRDGIQRDLGSIADPVALINSLKPAGGFPVTGGHPAR